LLSPEHRSGEIFSVPPDVTEEQETE